MKFLYVYRVFIYVVITRISTAQISSRFVKQLAFSPLDVCFVIWPVRFTSPLAHSFLFFSDRFGGWTGNCFFSEEAATLPTASGREKRENGVVDAGEGGLSSRVLHGGSTCPAVYLPEHLNSSPRPLHFLVVFVTWFHFDSAFICDAIISQLKTSSVLVCCVLILV
jgi:hypothetical protein